MKAAERSSAVRCGCSATCRAGPSRSRPASPSSVRTRTSAARERRGPRLRPLTPEQLLAGLTARHPRRAQGAVDGGQRVAQGEVPFVYS